MLVDVGHMLRKTKIVLRVALVSDQPEDVEPREEGCRELDVGLSRALDVVATVGGVCRSQDGDTSVEGCHDASLEGSTHIAVVKH